MDFTRTNPFHKRKAMLIKHLLNKVERFKSFVYESVCIMLVGGTEALIIDIVPRRNSRPICPGCGKRRIAYDRQPQRLFEYLPVWSFKVYFRYAHAASNVRSMASRLSLCLGGMARSG